jgi:predicted anti-sigma-YlaC factor YlaD
METEVKIELKYCERCGGLFYRRANQAHVYCVHCTPEMRRMVPPSRKLAKGEQWGRTVQSGGAACA